MRNVIRVEVTPFKSLSCCPLDVEVDLPPELHTSPLLGEVSTEAEAVGGRFWVGDETFSFSFHRGMLLPLPCFRTMAGTDSREGTCGLL